MKLQLTPHRHPPPPSAHLPATGHAPHPTNSLCFVLFVFDPLSLSLWEAGVSHWGIFILTQIST